MTREELWLAAIAGLEGVNPPDYPVWHYEQMLAAIYDAVTGAADPRPFPERSWHLDEFLYAVYCAVAGLDDPGCPAPTCRIEEFWNGIYDAATGDDSASVPNPVWRIEEFLSCIFDVASGWGASVLTETGNAPLTLANAIARAIKSLTQTGLCTQADTPTPSAPVDIKCNNGALRMVDDELPAGYNRVLGFSMKNNAYWEIPNFPMNGSDTLRFSFEVTDACNVIGAYSGSASGNNYSLYVSPTANYLRYKSGAYNSTVDFGTRYDVEITPTGTSGMKVNSTWTAQTFTTPTNFCIGTTSANASSAKLKGNLYGNIEVVGRAKFIPCERISDNVLGYYDLIGETFYMPTSGTPTSLGYDGSHCHLAVVGTPEVLTVGDQTATVPDLYAVGDYADEVDVISGTVTRRVGVKVLDGTEAWIEASVKGIFYCDMNFPSSAGYVAPAISSHFTATNQSNNSMPDCSCKLANTVKLGVALHIKYTPYAGNLDDWKFYLAAQYAAGTPVIIVYPLAEATTESVAGQPLHTVAGTNTVSVTAEVSPVALTCEYYGASS